MKISLEISASPELAALIQQLADALRGAAQERNAALQSESFPAKSDPPAQNPAAAMAVADAGPSGVADGDDVSSLNLRPAAQPPPAVFWRGPDKWSPDRIMQMALLRAEKTPWDQILVDVNALPGPKINSAHACEVAYHKFLRQGRLPKVVLPPAPVKTTASAAVGDGVAEEGGAATPPAPGHLAQLASFDEAMQRLQNNAAARQLHEAVVAEYAPQAENLPAEIDPPAHNPAATAVADASLTLQPPAVATPPAAVFSKTRNGAPVTVWTPERIQNMALMRACNESWAPILDVLNAMPGVLIRSPAAVESKYKALKGSGKLPKMVLPPAPVKQVLGGAVMLAPALTPSSVIDKPVCVAKTAIGETQTAPRVWTPERVKLLRKSFPTSRGLDAILILLNGLPGGEIKNVVEMKTKAAALGLKRPDFVMAGAAQATPKALTVGMATARAWAAERGLCNGGAALDMKAVNAKRASLGLAPFALEGRT